MSNDTNVRRIPRPILADVDELIRQFRAAQAEAELKRLQAQKPV